MTMMLDERKTNGHAAEPVTHAWEARLTAIERQLTAIAESGEQRVVMLRDAIADFAAAELAKRDEEIVSLKKQLAELQKKLEQQAAIDQRVHEISTRLEEKQARRDRAKNGITDGDFMQTMSMVIAQERQSARTEFEAADEEMQRALEAKLAEMEHSAARPCRASCRLPRAGARRASLIKPSSLSHEGSLYQARRDTATEPGGGSDWVCVARHGSDGRSPTIRGKFDVREKYAEFDIVTYDGFAFVAARDDPGICPGHGWEVISRAGLPGRRGAEKGERGETGAMIAHRSPVLSRFSGSGRWTTWTRAELARTFRTVPIRDRLAAQSGRELLCPLGGSKNWRCFPS